MSRRSRLIIALIWALAGLFNLFAYVNSGAQVNLVMLALDFALAVLYFVMAMRK